MEIHIKILRAGISLVVQWLRFCLPMEGVQVQSMVRELRVTCRMADIQNINNRNNIVTNSIKTLKMVRIK